ncbi:hypothetical protein Fcan01_23117, partial [Folsomia candida]
SYYAKEIVKVTPYTEFLAGEADLLPFFDTNLRVRSAQGKSCCFLFPQPPTTRVTIENEQQVGERAEFVGQLSFDYPNYWKDKNEKRIEFDFPESNCGCPAWVVTGKDIAGGAKIGLSSDSEQSPRFTTQGNTAREKCIKILNRGGEPVAEGRITLSQKDRGTETYKEMQIMLPSWGIRIDSNPRPRELSDLEREILFGVLILWVKFFSNWFQNSSQNSK